MYKLLLTRQAEKELASIAKPDAKRVSVGLDDIATLGTKASNTKKLQTPFLGYRKRVGDFRILFEVNEEIIIVYRISKRSQAYR